MVRLWFYPLTFLGMFAMCAPNASGQAIQEGFVRPPDVPAYVAVTDTYASGTTPNVIGDGSNDRGGTMPVLALQPADIPSTAPGWIEAVSCDVEDPGGPCHEVTDPPTEEAKFRTLADYSHVNYDDPIRNWGQPGTAHAHMFFGNTNTNFRSTYASLRTRANANANGTPKRAASTIAGGPLNGTAYWFPVIIKPNAFGDGKAYAVKVDEAVVYYVENPASNALASSRIPRGLRYILGMNMDDPRDTIIKAKIAAANAQPGTSGRYAYIGNGFVGWQCRSSDKTTIIESVSGEHYPAFKTAASADPWSGNCTAGMWLQAEFNAPACYDGRNLWSPGGYKHLRQRITDNVNTGSIIEGCPNGWFKLPQLSITLWFKHQGFSDYGTWYASSDAMATAAAQAINPADPAMRPGESMHTDWLGGWDDTTFMKWQDFCIGVSGGAMHVCDSSLISTTEALTGGFSGVNAPDSTRLPQVQQNPEFNTTSRSLMVQLPADPAGPVTTHAH